MVDLAKLTEANSRRWAAMKVRPELVSKFRQVAQHLLDPGAQTRYAAIEAKTGVPRNVIAVIHEREASQRFSANIAQGDLWNRVSVHVPAGRGPFLSFEAAAIDALTKCAPYAARWKDWSPGGRLTLLEQYNGLGYAGGPKDLETGRVFPPQPSPYIWAGTDQYKSGKYIRDHVYKPNVEDPQLGCAALLKCMEELAAVLAQPLPPPPDIEPTPPATPSVLGQILAALWAAFRKK